MEEDELLQNEAKVWLTSILQHEDFTVEIVGKSKKGENYMGDILFVEIPTLVKTYNLVLKCSKRSERAQQDPRFQTPFVNEIYFYDKLIPMLTQFQAEKKIAKPFKQIPKFYGSYIDENIKVLVLENMKKLGFELWPRKQALTKNHIDLVMEAYGKLHATSLALQSSQPEKFSEIANTLNENMETFSVEQEQTINMFTNSMSEAYNALKDELDKTVLEKWNKLKEQVSIIIKEIQDPQGLKVILHGDCWNNNFIYKYETENKNQPSQVVIIDWQMTRCSTPISDLSYFLFSCISEEDINDLEKFLRNYYGHFCDHLRRFGVGDPEELYPEKQFWDEWKRYGRMGVLLASLLLKICSYEEGDIVDLDSQSSQDGFGSSFNKEIQGKGKELFKKRIRYIIEYVAENIIE